VFGSVALRTPTAAPVDEFERRLMIMIGARNAGGLLTSTRLTATVANEERELPAPSLEACTVSM
jgi:hypothetical protein